AILLEVAMSFTLKASENSGICSWGSLVVVVVFGICRTPTVSGQMANSLALVAFWSTLPIMVIVAFGVQRFRSSVRFLLTRPCGISLCHILPFGRLLLVLIVLRSVIKLSLIVSLTFIKGADLLVHEFSCKFNCILHGSWLRCLYTSVNHVGQTTDILLDLIRLFRKHPGTHQCQLLKTLVIAYNIGTFNLQILHLNLKLLNLASWAVLVGHFLFQVCPSHWICNVVTNSPNVGVPPC
ncbi:hypothetical protein Tco_0141980, partial [Tanacetum coccineum]